MPYTHNAETSFTAQHESTEAYEKSQGTKIERYMDDVYEIINEIIEKWALVSVADIAALRALYDDANWDNSTTQHIARDLQVRKVEAASDGTNTLIALYWFDENNASSDVDGATGNVDTDGIVSPLSGRATGRWLRLCAVGNDGTAAYVHRLGIEALRTMTQNLYINLTAGSSDLALKTNKRTAGTQIKWTTDEEIAIRNIADSAYEDLACGLLTLSGNLSGAGTANVLSGAPVASATSALLRLGQANTGGSASGGFISINSATGYAGDFIRILLDGVVRLTLTNTGALTCANALTVSAGGAAITGGITVTGAASSIAGGNLNMNSNKITSVTDPTAAQDAATKAYVDAQVAGASPLWGDGSDGAVTISANTTLTNEKHYTTLTIDATFTLTLAGFPIFTTGALTLNGGINSGTGGAGANGGNGALGANSTAGAAGTNTQGVLPISNGVIGVTGVSGAAGTAGTAGSNITFSKDSPGTAVAGGAGGADEGASSAGGAGGAAGTVTSVDLRFRDIIGCVGFLRSNFTGIFNSAGSGSGGSGGGGADPNSGGGGGGSGAAAQTGLIVASTVTYGASSSISGVGGAGGNGGNGYNGAEDSGGGGGGSGGPGALIYLITSSVSGSLNATTVTGGAGGTGGTSVAGTAGSAGTIGPTGALVTINI